MIPNAGIIGLIEVAQSKGADVVPSPLEQVREFIRASKAENTLRGYQADWRDFMEWSQARELSPLPAAPETVVESSGAPCIGGIAKIVAGPTTRSLALLSRYEAPDSLSHLVRPACCH